MGLFLLPFQGVGSLGWNPLLPIGHSPHQAPERETSSFRLHPSQHSSPRRPNFELQSPSEAPERWGVTFALGSSLLALGIYLARSKRPVTLLPMILGSLLLHALLFSVVSLFRREKSPTETGPIEVIMIEPVERGGRTEIEREEPRMEEVSGETSKKRSVRRGEEKTSGGISTAEESTPPPSGKISLRMREEPEETDPKSLTAEQLGLNDAYLERRLKEPVDRSEIELSVGEGEPEGRRRRAPGMNRWYDGPVEQDPLFRAHADRDLELGPDDPRREREKEEKKYTVLPDGRVDFYERSPGAKAADTVLGVFPQVKALVSPFYKSNREMPDEVKKPFLEGTFEERATRAEGHRRYMRERALNEIEGKLAAIWRTSQTAEEKRKARQTFFDLWDETLEEGDTQGEGEEVIAGAMLLRARILLFIRKNLPQGGPDSFTREELTQFNRIKESRLPFDPYGPNSPALKLASLEESRKESLQNRSENSLEGSLDQLLADTKIPPDRKKREIFDRWDRALDEKDPQLYRTDEWGRRYVDDITIAGGTLVRGRILEWIRKSLPRCHPLGYSSEELVHFNSIRESGSCFDPYGDYECPKVSLGHITR